MSSSSSGKAVSVSESAWSWSPILPSRGDVTPVMKGSIGAEKFGRTARVMAALRRRRAIVSICAEAISPTSAGHSGWMRCLLHTAVFE